MLESISQAPAWPDVCERLVTIIKLTSGSACGLMLVSCSKLKLIPSLLTAACLEKGIATFPSSAGEELKDESLELTIVSPEFPSS
ncbi:MAG: hypothetical protein K9L96_05320 [Candidatus Omnitrophica bacterium]|nr:hypothetical protein [Candidatus Omnitrophota bacterium]